MNYLSPALPAIGRVVSQPPAFPQGLIRPKFVKQGSPVQLGWESAASKDTPANNSTRQVIKWALTKGLVLLARDGELSFGQSSNRWCQSLLYSLIITHCRDPLNNACKLQGIIRFLKAVPVPESRGARPGLT